MVLCQEREAYVKRSEPKVCVKRERGSKNLTTAEVWELEKTHALLYRQVNVFYLLAWLLLSKAFKALIIYFKIYNPPTNLLPQEYPVVT